MNLENFDRSGTYACFDPSSGTGDEFHEITDEATAGFCTRRESGWVAVYPDPDEDTLVVQIDGTTWDLYGPETVVKYYHEYDDAETHFRIEDGEERFETSYEAWWADRPDFDPNPWAASEEEENAVYDFFGYIRMLWQHEAEKDNWIDMWSANLTA